MAIFFQWILQNNLHLYISQPNKWHRKSASSPSLLSKHLHSNYVSKILSLQPEMNGVLQDLKIWPEMLSTTLFSGHWASQTFYLQIYQGK